MILQGWNRHSYSFGRSSETLWVYFTFNTLRVWYSKRGSKMAIFRQKYSFFIVSLQYSFKKIFRVLYLRSLILKVCQLFFGIRNPRFAQRFQMNHGNWNFFKIYKIFKMKKFLITRLHLSETHPKQTVNNKKFFDSYGVFYSFWKYIEYLKYTKFRYLEYSCVILPGS